MRLIRLRFSIDRLMIAIVVVACLIASVEYRRLQQRSLELTRKAVEFEESNRWSHRFVEVSERTANKAERLQELERLYFDYFKGCGTGYPVEGSEAELDQFWNSFLADHRYLINHYESLAAKYRASALKPWIPVEPDPFRR